MVGTQYTAIPKTQLGPALNGVISLETYAPEQSAKFPGLDKFLEKYQSRAAQSGVDPLGFYLPPFAYAMMQVIDQTVTKNKSIDQAKMAETMHKDTFDTVVGKVQFGKNGEWTQGRLLYVQYDGITGNSVDEWRKPGRMTVLLRRRTTSPASWKEPYQSASSEVAGLAVPKPPARAAFFALAALVRRAGGLQFAAQGLQIRTEYRIGVQPGVEGGSNQAPGNHVRVVVKAANDPAVAELQAAGHDGVGPRRDGFAQHHGHQQADQGVRRGVGAALIEMISDQVLVAVARHVARLEAGRRLGISNEGADAAAVLQAQLDRRGQPAGIGPHVPDQLHQGRRTWRAPARRPRPH